MTFTIGWPIVAVVCGAWVLVVLIGRIVAYRASKQTIDQNVTIKVDAEAAKRELAAIDERTQRIRDNVDHINKAARPAGPVIGS